MKTLLPRLPRMLTTVYLVVQASMVPSWAHSGNVAFARPVQNITIDGDFSDWPTGLHEHPIKHAELGSKPNNAADLDASFRLGYDLQAQRLYIAVSVQDSSPILEAEGLRSWNGQDGMSLYFDPEHGHHPTHCYQLNVYGNELSNLSTENSPFSVAHQHEATSHRYEWSIDYRELGEGFDTLDPFRTHGLDISICDRDADDSFTWLAWSLGRRKSIIPSTRGDVAFVSEDEAFGQIKGTVLTHHYARMSVQAKGHPNWNLSWYAGESGHYSGTLPSGDYLVGTSYGQESDTSTVRIEPNSTVTQDIAKTLRHGEKVFSGKGESTAVATRAGTFHESFRELNLFDGLPGEGVLDIAAGPKGQLWIAADRLAAYRGYEITVYDEDDGFFDERPLGVTAGPDGAIWTVSLSGIVRRDDAICTRYERRDGFNMTKAIYPERVPIVADEHGSVWVGHDIGLLHFDGETFVNHLHLSGQSTGQVRDLLADPQRNRLWIACDTGLFYYSNGAFASVAHLDQKSVRGIALSPSGQLYAMTANTLHRQLTDGIWDERALPPSEATWTGVAATGAGELWATSSSGSFRISEWMNEWDHLGKDPGYDITLDAQGNLFVATEEGVAQYLGSHWSVFDCSEWLDPDESIFTVLENRDGTRWIGSSKGLTKIRDSDTTHYTTKEGLIHNEARTLIEDRQGRLWVGTKKGVSCLSKNEFTNYTTSAGLTGNNVGAIVEDSSGRIWIGTTLGLTMIDGSTIKSYTSLSGLNGDDIRSLIVDRQGQVWAGSAGLTKVTENGLERFSPQVRFGNAQVTSLAEAANGHLWVGTEDGLFVFDGSTFTPSAPLVVRSVIPSEKGGVWAATNRGILHTNNTDSQYLSAAEGLLSSYVSKILPSRQGGLWITNDTNRYYHYTPSVLRPTLAVSKPLLSGNYRQFRFNSISLRSPGSGMRYRCRLLGNGEETWVETYNREITYEDLPAGDYKFQVQAIDRDLNKSPIHVAPFKIHANHSRWFWGAGLLGALGLAGWQTRRLTRSAQRLVRREARYRQLVEGVQDEYIFFSNDSSGAITYVSPSVERILSLPQESARGMNWRDFAIDSETIDGDTLENIHNQVFAGEAPERFQTRVKHPEGKILYLDIWVRPVLDVDGHVLRADAIAKDVTRQKLADEEIKLLNVDLEERVSTRTAQLEDEVSVRQRTENALAERLAFASLISELSASLIDIQSEELDKELPRALQKVAELVAVDRANLYLLDKPTETLVRAYFWNGPKAPELGDLIQRVPLAPIPWYRERFYAGEAFAFTSLDDLPEDALGERLLMQTLESKSILTIPLIVTGNVIGQVGFATTQEERTWSPSLIRDLRLFGEIIANALARRAKEEALSAAEIREKQQQRDFRQALLHGQENERTRIARELHDELGQSLTAMRIHTHWLQQQLNDQKPIANRVDGLMDIINEVIPDVKRICAELRPAVLDDLGLFPALEWLADEFETRTGTECDLEIHLSTLADDDSRDIALFRITQELLTNISRHANATSVKISLGKEADWVVLQVDDDGDGLQEGDQSKQGHFGLLGIQERAENLGGHVAFESSATGGLRVSVKVPC